MACGRVSKKAATITLGVSVFFLVLSIGLIFTFQKVYDIILKSDIALTKGSLVTKIWEDIPLPIYEKLYFFNITNADSFLDGKEPLNVTEVGPYVFKSRWVKHNPQWNANNTVSYKEIRTYQFVRDMSVGDEDDAIYTLNGPLIIGASVVPYFGRMEFDAFCRYYEEELVTKKSIRDLAYQGYKDKIIQYAWILKDKLPYKDGVFSWLYGKNASDDGLFTVFTGTDDEKKTNFINNWNGNETLSFWKGDSCNMLNGTSIETGPPIKGHQDSYTFFQSIFCRSLTFNYTEDTEHYGIPAKRFRPTYELFANSTENPENHCFEMKKERPSGILDIGSCQFDAPVFISFPHFHLADPSYLNSVNGLNASDEKHGSHIDVEPITGVSIDLTVRFQINVEVKKVPGIGYFRKVTKGIFPIFWAELNLKIDEGLANYMKRNVRGPKIIAYSILAAFLLIGWAGVIFSLLVLCRSKREEDKDPLITNIKCPTKARSQSINCDFVEKTGINPGTYDKNNTFTESQRTGYDSILKNELHETTVTHIEP